MWARCGQGNCKYLQRVPNTCFSISMWITFLHILVPNHYPQHPRLQGYPTHPFWRRSVLGVLWKEWCWGWNSSTLATSCPELTHWKRLWWWGGLVAGGKGNNRGWDGWMASLTWWMWVWVNSGSWWWTGRHGVLRFTGSYRVRHNWATELYWMIVDAAHLFMYLLATCRRAVFVIENIGFNS